jgi:rubrerythrin
MNKNTVNLLCLAGCAYLVFSTQAKARDAREVADAYQRRADELAEKARIARERAEAAQERLDSLRGGGST